METGDFDNTPAPSTRPSLAVLRPEEDDPALSISSSHQGSISYRHHLLKTSTTSPLFADRNLPVPPILSSYSLPKNFHARMDDPKLERENQSFVVEQQIKAPITPPPILGPGKYGVPLQSPRSERDPSSPPLTERKQGKLEHSRNQSRNTESSLDNVSTRDSGRLSSLVGRDSPVSDEVSIRSGEIHQTRADGTYSVTKVRIPVPRTHGHNPVVKVRPAFDQTSAFPGVDREHGTTPRSPEKVSPFDPELDNYPETSNIKDSRDVSTSGQGSVGEAESSNVLLFPLARANTSAGGNDTPHIEQTFLLWPQSNSAQLKYHGIQPQSSRNITQHSVNDAQDLIGADVSLSKVRPFEHEDSLDCCSNGQKNNNKPAVEVRTMPDDPLSRNTCNVTQTLSHEQEKSFKRSILDNSEHALDECEISNGEYQPQLKRASGQHSIRNCEIVPIESEFSAHQPEEHGMESNSPNPTRQDGIRQHAVSQCHIFPTSIEHNQHEWNTCMTVPTARPAELAHSIRECAPSQETERIETNQHDISDCQGDEHELKDIMSVESAATKNRNNHDSSENGTSKVSSNVSESGSNHHNALQWFKQVFRQRDSNESAPAKLTTMEHSRRRDSDSLRKEHNLDAQTSRSLTQSITSATSIDGVKFTQAVSDLERLFGEAISVISQAVEHSEKCCNQTIQNTEKKGHSTEIIEMVPHRGESAATRNSLSRLAQQSKGSRTAVKSPLIVPHRRSSRKRSPLSHCQLMDSYQQNTLGVPISPCAVSGAVCDVMEVVDFSPDGRNPTVDNTIRSITPPDHNLSSPNQLAGDNTLPERDVAGRQMNHDHGINLRHRSHSPARKRFVAAVACISTALIGLIVGIYSGLVPKIQYYIIDDSHLTILGNTGCFFGLAIPTFFCWPLPLLHGRKPYILTSLALAMPLLFPQALAVDSQRMVNTGSWRALLLASRTFMGASLGFSSMNFHSILTDLFGASLMSANPHEEVVDRYDARRHGGGMGIWLGIWTWCWIGSLAVGFLVGAAVINEQPPAWGFYISIILIAIVLILNIICPEVRRSAYRRSMTEVRTETDISRRIARGEVMMHRVRTGPRWCGQEVFHGVLLSLEMLHQPGFAVLAIYVAWIYAQIVLTIILLGSLTSKIYRLQSPYVGFHVGSVALGALLAIPFQKASIFSRSRGSRVNSSRATLDRKLSWTSHLVRRAVFTALLPVVGGCYAVASTGPPLHISVPTLLAFGVGLFSSLAISECNGIIMEAFDTSDLCPGMTGRQRDPAGNTRKRINYSSFPRVTSGYAIIHTFAFILSAGSTALGGYMTRTLGQRVSSGIVAGILFLLTMSLLLVLIRFKNVQIIPDSKTEEMEKIVDARRKSIAKIETITEEGQDIFETDEAWKPTMMGNPVSELRRMNVLEFGSMSRWQEIRKRNKLIDEDAHLCNRTALDEGLEALDDHMSELRRDAHELLRMASLRSLKGKRSRLFRRSDQGSENSHQLEMDNLSSGAESIEQTTGSQIHERDFGERTVLEEDEVEGTNSRQVRRG